VYNNIIGLVTGVNGTADSVIYYWRRADLAAIYGVTGLAAVTEKTVVAECIIGSVYNNIIGLVTGVVGTADSVIYYRRCAGLADLGVAGLSTIAEDTVIAVRILQTVNAGICSFIARLS
jgi:hypothetical protein